LIIDEKPGVQIRGSRSSPLLAIVVDHDLREQLDLDDDVCVRRRLAAEIDEHTGADHACSHDATLPSRVERETRVLD
jgi:hypothetical protein